MNTMNLVMLATLAVFAVLYMARRRNRLKKRGLSAVFVSVNRREYL